jgi:hypothetical protein
MRDRSSDSTLGKVVTPQLSSGPLGRNQIRPRHNMFDSRIHRRFGTLLIIASVLSYQMRAQVLMTARHLLTKSDSLIATRIGSTKLISVFASNVDTNGVATEWEYGYLSADTARYNVLGFNGQVAFADSFPRWVGFQPLANRWMDSDSALLIAQRSGGDVLIKIHPDCRIEAWLYQLVRYIGDDTLSSFPAWFIRYAGGDSSISFWIDANTSEVLFGGQIVLSVQNVNDRSLPTSFELHQNYPNPFNPTTNIDFDVPKNSIVTLKIFNLLGRETVTLVSQRLDAGHYKRIWNAGQLPSGVYFCVFRSGYYSKTIKLILEK